MIPGNSTDTILVGEADVVLDSPTGGYWELAHLAPQQRR
jgi:hypothetical protein